MSSSTGVSTTFSLRPRGVGCRMRPRNRPYSSVSPIGRPKRPWGFGGNKRFKPRGHGQLLPLLGKGGHCTTNRREGPDTPSAIANRQFGTSFCTILSNQSYRKVIDKADCRRMFQIGDRRMLVAYFRTEFVRRDLLCKAAKERSGVVRSIHRTDLFGG